MNIALVEDDPIQCRVLAHWMEGAGYQSRCFGTGEQFITSLDQDPPHLILLDWELPGISGLELLKQLREQIDHSLPVMFITGRDEEADIVKALKAGADDYLLKPLRRQELLARIEVLARRYAQLHPVDGIRQVGPFRIDLGSRQLHRNGNAIELTQKEFTLATHLLGNISKLLSREELLRKVWGHSKNMNTRTVDTHISRVRRKLSLVPEQGWNLSAVYQHGYRLDRLGGA